MFWDVLSFDLLPQGYFNYTVMYYGAYSNITTGQEPTTYNLQLAYFFTIAAYMVLCGGALIYRSVGRETTVTLLSFLLESFKMPGRVRL